MASQRNPEAGGKTSPREVETLAAVLEGRHGVHAADVADFFATLHGQHGDASRASAWQCVADMVRRRTMLRLEPRR